MITITEQPIEIYSISINEVQNIPGLELLSNLDSILIQKQRPKWAECKLISYL